MKNQWSDDDSSFICPSIPASSSSPTSLNSSSQESLLNSSYDSSNPHISAFETREDSFLENMYQFVRECLNNEGLMQRLISKKKHNTQDQNRIENDLISMKHIKKPRSEPKINKSINDWKTILIEFLKQNKLKLILILICVAMIVFRIQDLYLQQLESRRQGCLKHYKMDNIKDLKMCVQNTSHLITDLSLLGRMRLMFWDVHQFFYMGVILCASYHTLRNGVGLFQNASISFDEYYESYKKIHNINGQKKITLTQLKEQLLNKREIKNENDNSLQQQEQHNQNVTNPQRAQKQSKEVKILGMKIDLGLLSFKSKDNQDK